MANLVGTKANQVPVNGLLGDLAYTDKAQLHLRGSKVYNPGSLLTGASTATTVAITGAVLGDTPICSFSEIASNDIIVAANIESEGVVRIIFYNISAGTIDLPEGTINVVIPK
jgi:hypothetical protein